MQAKRMVTSDVYKQNLCCSCGLCAGFCPHAAISLRYDKKGFLKPVINEEKCVNCGLCVRFCPGKQYYKRNLGCTVRDKTILFGHSLKQSVRKNASSGGIVTELLVYLLQKGFVDYCVVTPDVYNVKKIKAILTNDVDVIYQSKTSKYCPVDYTEVIKKINPYKYRYAVVGLPCQIASLREKYKGKESQFFLIALICNHMPSANATVALQKNFRMDSNRGIAYRGGGWPGYMQMWKKKEYIKIPYRKAWNMTGFGKYFYNSRCRICNDALGEKADISVGDAYFLTEQENDIGNTVCILRKDSLRNILEDMQNEKRIRIHSLEQYFKMEKTLKCFRQRYDNISYELVIRKKLGFLLPEGSEEFESTKQISIRTVLTWFKREALDKLFSSNSPFQNLLWRVMFIKEGGNEIEGIKRGKRAR